MQVRHDPNHVKHSALGTQGAARGLVLATRLGEVVIGPGPSNVRSESVGSGCWICVRPISHQLHVYRHGDGLRHHRKHLCELWYCDSRTPASKPDASDGLMGGEVGGPLRKRTTAARSSPLERVSRQSVLDLLSLQQELSPGERSTTALELDRTYRWFPAVPDKVKRR